jgi:predicted cupin superfamily sugar epimerase
MAHDTRFDDGDVQALIARFHLVPHPEGGFYAETFRSTDAIARGDGQAREASTAIYFLLPAGTFSALHVVAADEVWHHYWGGALELVTLTPEGALTRTVLGDAWASGAAPQHVVPRGVWQAARPAEGRAVLVGCTVAPGFRFEDFAMPSRAALLTQFPQHADLVRELTRADADAIGGPAR